MYCFSSEDHGLAYNQDGVHILWISNKWHYWRLQVIRWGVRKNACLYKMFFINISSYFLKCFLETIIFSFLSFLIVFLLHFLFLLLFLTIHFFLSFLEESWRKDDLQITITHSEGEFIKTLYFTSVRLTHNQSSMIACRRR